MILRHEEELACTSTYFLLIVAFFRIFDHVSQPFLTSFSNSYDKMSSRIIVFFSSNEQRVNTVHLSKWSSRR